jgi:mRNA interferase RelE/StbE
MGKEYQEKVKQAVKELEIDPFFSKNVRRLHGELEGLYRYRIGRFRMIFRVLPETKEIRILAIASCGNAYK